MNKFISRTTRKSGNVTLTVTKYAEGNWESLLNVYFFDGYDGSATYSGMGETSAEAREEVILAFRYEMQRTD